MMVIDYLADVLCVFGLALLAAGIWGAFGWAWALMVVGALLLGIGLAAAWRRT